ncbi:hypothetical protein SDC9_66755 [bioreactor metagenome]|uniref:Uncharacterized protein n=1 Tax=bioreactor metagenome TaxID=1076179 RepID=A0A644XVT4_9ZZZZ
MKNNELVEQLKSAQRSLNLWAFEADRLQKEADIAARRKKDFESQVQLLKEKIAEAKE